MTEETRTGAPGTHTRLLSHLPTQEKAEENKWKTQLGGHTQIVTGVCVHTDAERPEAKAPTLPARIATIPLSLVRSHSHMKI